MKVSIYDECIGVVGRDGQVDKLSRLSTVRQSGSLEEDYGKLDV